MLISPFLPSIVFIKIKTNLPSLQFQCIKVFFFYVNSMKIQNILPSLQFQCIKVFFYVNLMKIQNIFSDELGFVFFINTILNGLV